MTDAFEVLRVRDRAAPCTVDATDSAATVADALPPVGEAGADGPAGDVAAAPASERPLALRARLEGRERPSEALAPACACPTEPTGAEDGPAVPELPAPKPLAEEARGRAVGVVAAPEDAEDDGTRVDRRAPAPVGVGVRRGVKTSAPAGLAAAGTSTCKARAGRRGGTLLAVGGLALADAAPGVLGEGVGPRSGELPGPATLLRAGRTDSGRAGPPDEAGGGVSRVASVANEDRRLIGCRVRQVRG